MEEYESVTIYEVPTNHKPSPIVAESKPSGSNQTATIGLIDFPDDVSVKSHENARGELIRVRVNPEDIGRVIGRSGRTANAIRTVVQALSDHKVRVDIMDVRR